MEKTVQELQNIIKRYEAFQPSPPKFYIGQKVKCMGEFEKLYDKNEFEIERAIMYRGYIGYAYIVSYYDKDYNATVRTSFYEGDIKEYRE